LWNDHCTWGRFPSSIYRFPCGSEFVIFPPKDGGLPFSFLNISHLFGKIEKSIVKLGASAYFAGNLDLGHAEEGVTRRRGK
jgi:hypothetical protein